MSVKAIDNVGNISESISSNGVTIDAFAGPPTVVSIEPDPIDAIWVNDQLEVTFTTSEPINPQLSISYGTKELGDIPLVDFGMLEDNMGYFITLDGLTIYADTITVILHSYTDLAGLSGDSTTVQYFTNYLADYNMDWTIDVLDLAEFASDWASDELVDDSLRTNELGPVLGDVPYFTLTPDGIFNIRDVMAFTRMWNWSHQQQSMKLIESDVVGIDINIEQNGNSLSVYSPEDAVSGQIYYEYPESKMSLDYKGIESTNKLILGKNDEVNGKLLIEYSVLSDDPILQIPIDITAKGRDDSQVKLSYTYISANGDIISHGKRTVDIIAIPDKYALHQNYPNPFNPVTTIEYDLPKNGKVVITVYDILGREIISLLNTNMKAGYHSIQWDGTNTVGKSVSAGMYFYSISAGDFNSVKKMVLLK